MEENKEKGLLIILSGPSGAGKGTVVAELIKEDAFVVSISATTRPPRNYESDGVHYFFHTDEEFEKMKQNNELLEWACYCGNYYGTPKKYVEDCLSQGKNVILEIEVQGGQKVKSQFPDCVLILMIPPSIEELRRRLKFRNTESDEVIEKRIHRALEEIEVIPQYDYVVMNDTIEKAKEQIKTIVAAEIMRGCRNQSLVKKLKGEM